MAIRHVTFGAAVALALASAGCSSTAPAEYAGSLPSQDPKWSSVKCRQKRADAATYETREKPASLALLGLGPYGMGILAAAREHQAKKRREFMRDLHLVCSSQPLPADLAASTQGQLAE